MDAMRPRGGAPAVTRRSSHRNTVRLQRCRRIAQVDATALKAAKPLLEPPLKGLVEYCGSQGSSICESVRASAGADRATMGASRPAPASPYADSPAAIVHGLVVRWLGPVAAKSSSETVRTSSASPASSSPMARMD